MTPGPRLTSIQSDLVALLHEIGGVIEEETFQVPTRRTVGLAPVLVFTEGPNTVVRLIMTGDGCRRVRVLIGPYADVEWEVIGQ